MEPLKIGSCGLTKTGVIVIYLMVLCTIITNAQLKKRHYHQEEVESNLIEYGRYTAKYISRIQTVGGKGFLNMKLPSPKPVDWHWNTWISIDGGRRGEAFLREGGLFSFTVGGKVKLPSPKPSDWHWKE